MKHTILFSSFLVLSLSHNAYSKTVNLPEKHILDTAKKLHPQTGPYYLVHGYLNCAQVVRHYEPPFFKNPYTFEFSTCEMTVNNKTIFLTKADDIIDVLKEFKPRADKEDWSISVKFTAHSIAKEFPPYSLEEGAIAEDYE